jgi:hypothetical protein
MSFAQNRRVFPRVSNFLVQVSVARSFLPVPLFLLAELSPYLRAVTQRLYHSQL